MKQKDIKLKQTADILLSNFYHKILSVQTSRWSIIVVIIDPPTFLAVSAEMSLEGDSNSITPYIRVHG